MIENLKPQAIWKHFYNITQIPHPSKKEEKMVQHIVEFAEKNKLEYKKDEVGNIIIFKPATAGREKAPVVVLQGHIDMVCEKLASVEHDFDNDPLKIKIEGEWLKADGTTLGADDGIGAAAMMAVLEDKTLEHGPLECLFTIDEETGMTGVMALKKDFFSGKILLNLDSEDDGIITIGCAGGKHTVLNKKIEKIAAPAELSSYRIVLDGLNGGHSGVMIHQGLGNGIKLIARFLWNLNKKLNLTLIAINGGDKHNAIPREVTADIMISDSDKSIVEEMILSYNKIYKNEYKVVDDNVKISLSPVEKAKVVYSDNDKETILNMLYVFPHGVITMSKEMEGLVETSTNLAAIKDNNGQIEILTSQRSSKASAVDGISNRIIALAEMSGFNAETGDGYPAWEPNINSPLLKKAISAQEKLYGKKPVIEAIHAGLECGFIGDNFENMDMISFGPTIRGAHTPEERVHIPAVEKFWDFLVALLKEF